MKHLDLNTGKARELTSEEATVWTVPQPTERLSVRKSVVVGRVIAAGKAQAAFDLLTQYPDMMFRWNAPDRPVVYCDDADTITMLQILELDPEVILAPEGDGGL